MDARDPGGSRRCTDRGVGITVHVLKAFGCQLVDIGSNGIRVSITANPIDVVVFTSQPEDVRSVCRRSEWAEREKDEWQEVFHVDRTPVSSRFELNCVWLIALIRATITVKSSVKDLSSEYSNL